MKFMKRNVPFAMMLSSAKTRGPSAVRIEKA